MKELFRSIITTIINILTNHKLFTGLLFILTAGQEFPLPEWLNIMLGLAMMVAVIFWFLNQR